MSLERTKWSSLDLSSLTKEFLLIPRRYQTCMHQNQSEVRSLLGLAQFSARFIKNFATLTEPLRDLTKQTSEWRWGEKEASAFQRVKDSLEESATTAYFDMHKDIEIVVDASPVGLAALLVQEGRVVIYASRGLTNVETRYSQTEREALAVVWACEHFNRFVKGAPRFTVISYHKPLEFIWQKARPPLRIERWGLRLQPYNMVIKYRPGAQTTPRTTCPDIQPDQTSYVVVNSRWQNTT